MAQISCLLGILATASCAVPEVPPPPEPAPNHEPAGGGAVDDGSFLGQIDPLGGQWTLEHLGNADFGSFAAWINFSAGGFLNHGAGCRGGYPAFYRLDGQRLTITRREAIRVGKCGEGTASTIAAAAASEQRLASYLDQTAALDKAG